MAKLKKLLIMALCFLLTVILTLGGTVAFLQDTDSDVNVMTFGSVKIEQIEQERDANGDLVDFYQNKPLYPAVFEGDRIPWADAADWVFADEQAWKTVAANENVVDKFVTVKNTGKTPAYVRTIIAYEGDEMYGPNGAYIHVVHNTDNIDPAIALEDLGVCEINGVEYTVFAYTYPTVLSPDDSTVPSLKQVYMNNKTENDVLEKYGDSYDILVLSQAVQAEGFANAATALSTAFPYGTDNSNLIEWFEDEDFGKGLNQYDIGDLRLLSQSKLTATDYNLDDGVLYLTSDKPVTITSKKTGTTTSTNIVVQAKADITVKDVSYVSRIDEASLFSEMSRLSATMAKNVKAKKNERPRAFITLESDAQITLEEVIISAGMGLGIDITAGKSAVVSLVGENIIENAEAAIQVLGNLVINGDGKLKIDQCTEGLRADGTDEETGSIDVQIPITMTDVQQTASGNVSTNENGTINGEEYKSNESNSNQYEVGDYILSSESELTEEDYSLSDGVLTIVTSNPITIKMSPNVDKATATLNLRNGANVTLNNVYISAGMGIGIFVDKGHIATINLVGENTIFDAELGVNVSGELTINGEGTLKIDNCIEGLGTDHWSDNGSIVVNATVVTNRVDYVVSGNVSTAENGTIDGEEYKSNESNSNQYEVGDYILSSESELSEEDYSLSDGVLTIVTSNPITIKMSPNVDKATATLNLQNGANVTLNNVYISAGMGIGIFVDKGHIATINLVGVNTIFDAELGVNVSGELTINGEGTLKIDNCIEGLGTDHWSDNGSIVVNATVVTNRVDFVVSGNVSTAENGAIDGETYS